LWRAWVAVRRNSGAPGIDKITLGQVEEYGAGRLLGELASELREGRYRPLPARRVYIPKPGAPAGEQRPLSIPSVRDRIVQAAAKIVLEPVFEADFLPCSFGFRPGRSPQDALQVLVDECARGRRWYPFRPVIDQEVCGGIQGFPAMASRRASRGWMPWLRAVPR
jgi:RNA-directed DNA polymerase